MERRKPNMFVLATVAVVHVVVVALTWRDIGARPPEQVRGNKKFWRVVSALNTANAVVYWLVGRRRTHKALCGRPAPDSRAPPDERALRASRLAAALS